MTHVNFLQLPSVVIQQAENFFEPRAQVPSHDSSTYERNMTAVIILNDVIISDGAYKIINRSRVS